MSSQILLEAQAYFRLTFVLKFIFFKRNNNRIFLSIIPSFGYQGSAVLDETEREAGTTSVPIPQGEDSENTPLPDLPEQPENVQRPGSEVVEKGMLT